ncbi:hypothetical protein FLA_3594 [Filimonas lacunae]|nr:hypothetical protein FLA_3594 [Filimonas lacunae]
MRTEEGPEGKKWRQNCSIEAWSSTDQQAKSTQQGAILTS